MSKTTLLAQMIQLLPAEKFKKIANELESNKHSKGIDSWTHMVTILFYHLSNAAFCRDISNGLMSIAGNIEHIEERHLLSTFQMNQVAIVDKNEILYIA